MSKNIGFENTQVAYAQESMAASMSNGYTAKQAAQIHLDSLRFISAIKSMDQAMSIVTRAAKLNGMEI